MALKPFTDADLALIFPWRNAPAVRRAMYSHHEISLEEHRACHLATTGSKHSLTREHPFAHDAKRPPATC